MTQDIILGRWVGMENYKLTLKVMIYLPEYYKKCKFPKCSNS